MNVTLDQARALDALARHGTFAAAAKALHKGHSAVLYLVDKLEEQSGLQLLDRGGYRNKLTTAGTQVLEHCRRLLAAERDLVAVCDEIKTGWEPSLHVIFDAIFPAEPILRVIGALSAERAPTRLAVAASSLGDVEARFVREEADVMITILPPQSPGLRVIKLPPLRARLVAHRSHPLARREGKLRREDLDEHVIVTVRGSDPRLQLSTGSIERRSNVILDDFAAKKAVIMQGIGFGWLPEHMMQRELRRGELVPLALDRGSTHAFAPRLCHRDVRLGRAATRLVEALTK